MDQNKQKLLLLHGAVGNEDQMREVKQKLSGDYDTTAFTFPGHKYEDSWDGDFKIETLATALEKHITANKLDGCNVFGFSLGGYVSLYLAYRNPKLFSKIFSLGTNLFWEPESTKKAVSFLNAEAIKSKVPAYADALRKSFGEHYWELVLKKTSEMMLSLGDCDLLTEHVFQKIDVPVCIAVSDKDEMVNKEKSKLAVKNLENGSFVTIDNSRHAIEKTNLDDLIPKVKRFYEDSKL